MSEKKKRGPGNPNISSYKNGFDKNPQNINRNGRPKKMFTTISGELRKEGIQPLKKGELIDAYELIFNTPEATLKALEEQEQLPIALKIIIQELQDPSARAKAWAEYRDYVYGRAATTASVKVEAEVSDLIEVPAKYQKLMDQMLEDEYGSEKE